MRGDAPPLIPSPRGAKRGKMVTTVVLLSVMFFVFIISSLFLFHRFSVPPADTDKLKWHRFPTVIQW